jgi:hypothetical protein
MPRRPTALLRPMSPFECVHRRQRGKVCKYRRFAEVFVFDVRYWRPSTRQAGLRRRIARVAHHAPRMIAAAADVPDHQVHGW